ncbi:MAG: DUF11 domain-containing protein [Gammaproteobacteria bacterium]|nr:DUF11 domain-containing protein [Gammaproteobacteria bacterium]
MPHQYHLDEEAHARFGYPKWREVSALLGLIAAWNAPIATAATEPVIPIGGEFQVNSYTEHVQSDPAVAVNGTGEFIIVWTSDEQDGHFDGIFGQRYRSDGLPEGDEFIVNATTDASESDPGVAMADNGDMVVVWRSSGSIGIRAQRFAADGIALGAEAVVDNTGQPCNDAEVSMDADGNYVVVWRRYEPSNVIYGRRFNADGTVAGPEFRASSEVADDQTHPDVAMAADGSFVVTWMNDNVSGATAGEIFARRFDPDGEPLGDSFRVSSVDNGTERSPFVGINASGQFVIAWKRSSPPAVYAQRFAADGSKLGGEFRADVPGDGDGAGGSSSDVLMFRDGGFLIVWDEANIDGNGDAVVAQRFAADGSAIGAELLERTDFVVNTSTEGDQTSPMVAGDADGDFVVVWKGEDQGGESDGIFSRRYSGIEAVDLAVVVQDDTDPVQPGSTFAYTLTVTNNHPVDENPAVGIANDVQLNSTLPEGVSFSRVESSDWSCTQQNGTVNCLHDVPLMPMTSASIEIEVQAPASSGTVATTAFVTARQFDENEANAASSNNFDKEETTVASSADPNPSDPNDSSGEDDGGSIGEFALIGLLSLFGLRARRPSPVLSTKRLSRDSVRAGLRLRAAEMQSHRH